MAWWKRKQSGTSPAASAQQAPVPMRPGAAGRATKFQQLKARLMPWRHRAGTPPEAAAVQAPVLHEPVQQQDRAADALLVHDDCALAFGLHWHLLQEKGKKQKLHTQALAQGHTHHVVGLESEQVGFLTLPQGQGDKRAIYAAALLLSETVSLGGDEVFVFRVDESRHALVALKNSMPVPGFDLIGSAATMARAANDYLSLPHRNEVRRCGDADILRGAESFDFAVALDALEKSHPRLKPIPDLRKRVFQGAVLAGGALVAVLAWATWSYFQAQEEAERLRRESDPNLLYEQSFSNSSASIKGLGTPGLKAMLATLSRIPMDVAGWSLSSVACQPHECVAIWTRQYGNYADFDAHLPPDVTQKPEYGFLGTDTKNTQLKTRHPVLPQAATEVKGLKREALPVVVMLQSDFVSRLQDYTLIDARVQVLSPSPFPSGVGDIGPVFKPVVSGTWSMELPLWTMDSLALPDYVQLDSLNLELGPLATGRTESTKGAKNYKLTGKYYAKGKAF
jgi:hypothetical protein